MDLAESLAAAFDQARESVLSFFQQLSEENPLLQSFNPAARVTEEAEPAGIPFALDFTRANKELQSFQKEANKELKLSASAGAIVSAGTAALNQLKSLFASTSIPLKVQVSEETTVTPAPQATAPLIDTSAPAKAATGGRFTAPKQIEIAEDGDPEYVIPVKKESLALPLLRQLTGELSDSARETLLAGMPGKKDSGSLSALPDFLSSAASAAAPVIHQTSHASVQAPVSINVTAAGSNPEAVGQSIYDVTEQYLLRTLQNAI
jgi:hypothetical protein